jgi:hypothetical protein
MTKENEEKKILNIYQKLVEVRKTVSYLKKDVKGYQYTYTKESAVIGALRPALDDLGLFIEIEMLEPKHISDKIVQIGFEFTIINAENPNERIIKHIYLEDLAGDPKKIGGLLTYAHRYFLLKFFEIATDDLDIDAYQEKTLSNNTTPKAMASDEDIKAIQNRLHDHPDIQETLLKLVPGGRLENIVADKIPAINKWLDKRIKGEK